MVIKTDAMLHVEHHADLCIIGGGLSGMIAAISAAREGVKVVLMQDRPVLGGNASSEIRMWIRGAAGECNRETGILSELEEENIYRNPELTHSTWDAVLWGKVKDEKNIDLLLNCTCVDADTENDTVKCVKGWQLTTYTWHTVYAKYFADCSGDSVLAPVTGALYRVGREGHSEYNETIGPEVADKKTMGMSCLLQARETDHPVRFVAPSWAYVYESDADLGGDVRKKEILDADYIGRAAAQKLDSGESVASTKIKTVTSMSRPHKIGTDGTNFWWIEIGGETDSLHDAETNRDELLKIAYGVWDHVKNRGDHGAENWELEWVGFLPGKRESRRYIGRYVVNQRDVEAGGKFDDVIAFGGWPMDDHNPAGFYSFKTEQPPSLLHPAPSPYGIPYRCLYSANIKNLFFAGRNVSATHAANSSMRVMATCALLGQAMGTAASMCINMDITPDEVYEKEIKTLQKKLIDAGCYLPLHKREIPALTLGAQTNLTEAQKNLLFNGLERPDENGTVNYITLPTGGEIEYRFEKPEKLNELRIMFDRDFSRMSISKNKKMRVFAMKCCRGLDFDPVKVAATLVKSFDVLADGKVIYSEDNNYSALVRIPLEGVEASNITVRFKSTNGSDDVHIFSCDIS